MRPPTGNASNCCLQLAGVKLSAIVIFTLLVTDIVEKVFVTSLKNDRHNMTRTIATGARYCSVLLMEGIAVVSDDRRDRDRDSSLLRGGLWAMREGSPFVFKAQPTADKVGHEIVGQQAVRT